MVFGCDNCPRTFRTAQGLTDHVRDSPNCQVKTVAVVAAKRAVRPKKTKNEGGPSGSAGNAVAPRNNANNNSGSGGRNARPSTGPSVPSGMNLYWCTLVGALNIGRGTGTTLDVSGNHTWPSTGQLARVPITVVSRLTAVRVVQTMAPTPGLRFRLVYLVLPADAGALSRTAVLLVGAGVGTRNMLVVTETSQRVSEIAVPEGHRVHVAGEIISTGDLGTNDTGASFAVSIQVAGMGELALRARS